MDDGLAFPRGFLVGVLLMVVIVVLWQTNSWMSAEDVLMNVDVGGYGADGQAREVVPCMGRIRYDRTGRIHIIGGIEQTVTTEGVRAR